MIRQIKSTFLAYKQNLRIRIAKSDKLTILSFIDELNKLF